MMCLMLLLRREYSQILPEIVHFDPIAMVDNFARS